MRTILIALALVSACSLNDVADDTSEYVCGPPSELCESRNCIRQVENFDVDDCCDSITCNCNPQTEEWDVHNCQPGLIDAEPSDASPDASPADAAQ